MLHPRPSADAADRPGRSAQQGDDASLRWATIKTVSSHDIGKALIIIGIVVLIVGVLVTLSPRIPLLGRLPGDLSFHRGEHHIFVPIVTCILLSIGLTVVVNVVLRLLK